MLKGIHPALSPELLKILCEMGHGDEILLADAHFPAHKYGKRVIRADGITIETLLIGIMPLFELDDSKNKPIIMMQADGGDSLDPCVEQSYLKRIESKQLPNPTVTRAERAAFYQRVTDCYAVILTGQVAAYGNIILRKGVTPL